ncbi:hypothetical protein GCM10009854_23510 [Saccharopolyspora halophila]|uniref:Uncharacterized protein n=1 Tax=Saccharopolyspora halophila TaxID=405551 RepID=A0ABN3G7Q2_9PSEU
MNPGKHAALIAGLALALSGCIGTAEEEKPAPPPPSVSEQEQPPPSQDVEPAPAAPPAGSPADNCELNPADVDAQTKARCGLSTSGSSTGPSPGSGAPPEGDHSFETFCSEGLLGPEHGCPSALTPEDDGPGSSYTNPESPQYQQYREDTGYPYPEEQYDELHGYQQCGTACGQDPTSGELQHQHGCEQGYITEGC